jgi:multidrug efflux pump subunit AcrB
MAPRLADQRRNGKIEAWLQKQPEAKIVTAYIGQGSPRFYLAMAPELPDPSFAKIVVLTDSQQSRDALKLRLREAVASGLAPEARVRVTQLVFGPYSPFPVAWRVMGPDSDTLRDIADKVKAVLQASPMMRTVNTDWGSRFRSCISPRSGPSAGNRFNVQCRGPAAPVPAIGYSHHLRAGRYSLGAGDGARRGRYRLDPAKLRVYPGRQCGTAHSAGANREVEVRMEDPLLRRRDRTPTITVRGDIADNLQPPDVSAAIMKQLQPIVDSLRPDTASTWRVRLRNRAKPLRR